VSTVPRERLQPSLLDRLNDDLSSALGELAAKRRALERVLQPAQRAELDRLVADERLLTRSYRVQEIEGFAELDEDARALAGRVLELEQARRLELDRSYVISMERLRAAVLRDLGHLLNTASLESLEGREGGAPVGLFERLPAARDSVLNYGIPALAGRIRTSEDYEELTRQIEQAIARFEPRLTDVKVTVEHDVEGRGGPVRSPVTLLIEGDLWGYPLPESLRLRTVLDLEDGKALIEPGEAA
jgi:type VI secretion system protein ImpF